MTSGNPPLLSIGLPVYNGERFLLLEWSMVRQMW
jgi:hypothetical protein